MKNLIRLVKTLKTKEIQLLQQLYKNYFRETSREYMGLILFNCILKDKVQNNSDAVKFICPNKHSSVVSQVKKKLECDILNVMLLSTISENNNQCKTPEFNCHKNLLVSKMLIDRGLTEEAVCVLQVTSLEAEKAELLDVKINCDSMLYSVYHIDSTHNFDFYHKTGANSSIERFSNVLHAQYINHPYMFGRSVYDPQLTSSYNPDELLVEMHKTTSRKAVYWYSMGIIHYYIQQQDHQHAIIASVDLLNQGKLKVEMSSSQERSEFYLQMSRILLYLGDPYHAIVAAQNCIDDMPPGISNMTLPYQILFRAYLGLRKMDKAMEIINNAFDNKNSTGNLKSVWYIFRAGILFLQNKYKESGQLLISHEQDFNVDQSQKTYAMLFELLNILETGDIHWFDYKLEAFRKRFDRHTLKDGKRIFHIYQMISLIKRNNYQYIIKKKSLVESLHKIPVIQWDPLGNEVIDISDWMRNKMQLSVTG